MRGRRSHEFSRARREASARATDARAVSTPRTRARGGDARRPRMRPRSAPRRGVARARRRARTLARCVLALGGTWALARVLSRARARATDASEPDIGVVEDVDPTSFVDGESGRCGVGGEAFGERACGRERAHEALDVVAVAVKPSCVNAVAIAALNQYVGPRRIVIVAPDEGRCATYREMATNVECHAEDAFVAGVTKDRIERALEELYSDELGLGGARSRFVGRELGGWYLQQIIKMGASTSKAISSPPLSRKFLLWDLDMIPLRPLTLFHKDALGNPRAVRQIGGNIIKSYESAYEELTGDKMTYAKDGTSYVTHQMVVDANIMEEMLSTFARRADRFSGIFSEFPPWVTAILQSLDRKDLKLGFSEYASYASYVAKNHPEEVVVEPRKNWARASGGKLGISFQRWLSKDGLCCPGPSVLALMKGRHFEYVGHEIGHVESCRYNAPEHEFSYGLPMSGWKK